jgi:hypothetical protein
LTHIGHRAISNRFSVDLTKHTHARGADVAPCALADLAIKLAHQRDAGCEPNFGAGGEHGQVGRAGLAPLVMKLAIGASPRNVADACGEFCQSCA